MHTISLLTEIYKKMPVMLLSQMLLATCSISLPLIYISHNKYATDWNI